MKSYFLGFHIHKWQSRELNLFKGQFPINLPSPKYAQEAFHSIFIIFFINIIFIGIFLRDWNFSYRHKIIISFLKNMLSEYELQ